MKQNNVIVDRLTEILVKQGALSENAAASAREVFARSASYEFDYFLLEEGLVNRPDLLRALSECYGVASFDVLGYFFIRDELVYFPKDFLLRHAIIPVGSDEITITIVAADPTEPELREKIGNYTTNVIEFNVGLRRDIVDAIREYYDYSDTQDEVVADGVEVETEFEDIDSDMANFD